VPEAAVDGVLFDLDGTVYVGDDLVPGAAEAVRRLRAAGVAVGFLSNKAIERRGAFAAKLTDLGVPADESAVVNSASIAASVLARDHPDDDVFVVGEPPLTEELAAHDVATTDDPAEADVLLASMDREFDYETLSDAFEAVDGETPFLATNPDRTCPVTGGEIPDCASMVGAIEGASGETLDRVLGKPSPTAVAAASDLLGAPLERCAMVGDRVETDVAMGNRAGMTTVLVRSGVTDDAALAASDVEPDHVVDSVADIDDVLPLS
jgi:arabinose operon protein AraL